MRGQYLVLVPRFVCAAGVYWENMRLEQSLEARVCWEAGSHGVFLNYTCAVWPDISAMLWYELFPFCHDVPLKFAWHLAFFLGSCLNFLQTLNKNSCSSHQQLVGCNAAEQSQMNVWLHLRNQVELSAITKGNLKETKTKQSPKPKTPEQNILLC